MSHSAVPTVLVIVAGSIAATKAPSALRRLREVGADLRVIATPAALQFVTELSLATAAQTDIATDQTWFKAQPDAAQLQLSRVGAVLVLGATADLMARAAAGVAGDLAAASLLATTAPVIWIPAMNEKMWNHPATQRNRETLLGWGHRFWGPVTGALGTRGEGEGMGRMIEPEDVAQRWLAFQELPTEQGQNKRQTEGDLKGKRVVISAGPTREYLDPVRFISNPSSGKMGFAVAAEAHARGAEVILVAGPVSIEPPQGVIVKRIETALELREVILQEAANADVVVMTAAVADYRAKHAAHEKQPKVAGDVTIELTPNPDILAELGRQNKLDRHDKKQRVLVGFAMETHAGTERAAEKARRKNADFILLNYPTREGTGFGADDNEVTLVKSDGQAQHWPRMTKREVARRLLNEAVYIIKNST